MSRRRAPWLMLVALAAFVHGIPAVSASPGQVYAGDFPDPFVLRVGTGYYAYATETDSISVQRMRSSDGRSWQHVGNALPVLPAWAERGHTWAPSVLPRLGYYVLYYTVRDRASGRQCISRAVAYLPQGPFVDSSSRPWICQLERGGSIDPHPVVDAAGRAYLLWKSDDNAIGQPTRLWAQRLGAGGLTLEGQPTEILAQDQSWEAPAIEGPAMLRMGETYYLFYGANWWESARYGIGYATCSSPLGPCTKVTTSGPWLASAGTTAGPGGPSPFTSADGSLWMAYHAWTAGQVGYSVGGARSLHVDRLEFVEGRPALR